MSQMSVAKLIVALSYQVDRRLYGSYHHANFGQERQPNCHTVPLLLLPGITQ
jgi:hypothetical protein